jgi:hypothetical protein
LLPGLHIAHNVIVGLRAQDVCLRVGTAHSWSRVSLHSLNWGRCLRSRGHATNFHCVVYGSQVL